VLIELFWLGVTAEELLRANIG